MLESRYYMPASYYAALAAENDERREIEKRLLDSQTTSEQVTKDLAFCIRHGFYDTASDVLKDTRVKMGQSVFLDAHDKTVKDGRLVIHYLAESKPDFLSSKKTKDAYQALTSEIMSKSGFDGNAIRKAQDCKNNVFLRTAEKKLSM